MNESRILSGLPVFRAVATLGSFSLAANHLGVTPSAVSQSIRALEEQLGAQLIARTSRSMRLTEAGAQFLADIDGPLTQLSQALLGLRTQEAQIEGPLRIVASQLATQSCIAPRLPGFLAAYPAIRLDLIGGEMPADLARAGVDAAIGLEAPPDSEVTARPIGAALRRCVLASPAYVARHGAPTRPEELMAHRICRYRFAGSSRPAPLQFRHGPELLELDPIPAMILDELATIGAVLQSGQVMAQVFRTGDAPAGDGLVELLAEFAPPPLQFSLFYPTRLQKNECLRAFLDWFTPPGSTPPQTGRPNWAGAS